MSQNIFPNINPTTTSGIQLATLLNDFKAALMTTLSGTSRPTELLSGGMWLDTSQEGSPNFKWILKMYDGTADRTLLTLNLSTGGVILAGSETEFNITQISADAVGALLKFTKRRVANNGQLLAGDSVGEMQFIGRGNDSSNPLTALIKAVAQENTTAVTSSSYIDFEATPFNSVARSVFARLRNSMLGVGAGFDPENTVHARGTTGIKSERIQDDALGAQFVMRKKRITGTGATQNNDIIGVLAGNTTDDASAEATTARLEVVATQNHTASAQGTKWIFRAIANGSAALSAMMEVGEEIKSLVLHSLERLKLNSQDVATTATIAQLSSDKAIVRFTGSTQTDLQGINSASGKTKVIVLHNASTASVICKHANAGATAADRFELSQSRDVTIKAGSSAEFFYDETAARWKVKSGAGSGGGEVILSGTRASPNNITAAGGITASTTDLDTLQFVQGNAGHIEITANPQISAGFQVGQRMRTVGRNDSQSLTFVNGNGVVTREGGNVTLNENTVVSWLWDGVNWIQE